MDFPTGPNGRMYDLVCAVAGEEITTREFHHALTLLPSESIQYVGAVLALQACLREAPSPRLGAARAICRKCAVSARCSN
jgi:hypothetical protein